MEHVGDVFQLATEAGRSANTPIPDEICNAVWRTIAARHISVGMARILLLSVIGAAFLWSNEPLSADSLYWAELSYGIHSANLNGTNEKVILSQVFAPTDIAIDGSAGKIYWADNGLDDIGRIGRADLNGSGEQTLVQANYPYGPYGLALDIPANKMYWTNGNGEQIIRANLDGSDPQTVLSGPNGPAEIALDVADGKMYWTSGDGHTISDANLDGTDQQVLFSGLSEATGVAVDVASGKLYWLDWGGIIQDANLDGSNRKTVLTGVPGQDSLTLDLANGKMYWTTAFSETTLSTGEIWSANLDGTGQKALISGLNDPVGITLLSETVPPVPEPPTSALVATGILGVIGCAIVRRTSLTS
jgi:hypothetical protein